MGWGEHYYQVHKKEFLYFCTKCGKGFFHKSKKSNHKKVCPKKDGADTHAASALYDEELEKTFKRRTWVEVDVPEEVLDLAKQYQAEENKECEEASAALQKELKKDKPIEVGADDDDSQWTCDLRMHMNHFYDGSECFLKKKTVWWNMIWKCALMKFWFLKKFKNDFKENFVILRRTLFFKKKNCLRRILL